MTISSLAECMSALCLALESLLGLRMLFLGAGGDPFQDGSAVTFSPCSALVPQPARHLPSPGQAGLPFSLEALFLGV